MEKVTTQEKNQGPRLGKSFRQGTQACLKHEVQKKKKKVKERKKKASYRLGEKCLQITYTTKALYPCYIKNLEHTI